MPPQSCRCESSCATHYFSRLHGKSLVRYLPTAARMFTIQAIQAVFTGAAGRMLFLTLHRWRNRHPRHIGSVPVSSQWLTEQKRHLDW